MKEFLVKYLMNSFLPLITPMIFEIFGTIISKVRNLVKDELLELHAKAIKTKNPLDDMLTTAALILFGIPVPNEVTLEDFKQLARSQTDDDPNSLDRSADLLVEGAKPAGA